MNFLLFGPNGSGKGTQGAILQKVFSIPHIETGVIFRKNILGSTDIGRRAKEYINRGELVPDDITIPMIMNRIKKATFGSGWLLDGFPRNLTQAEALHRTLEKELINLDFVIQIVLDRDTAKKRIMGRRLCMSDNNHPNNIYIDAIRPVEKDGKMVCCVCGCATLSMRDDDQDEAAIDKRLSIYFNAKMGTLAAVNYFKKRMKVNEVYSLSRVEETSENLMKSLVYS
ncbi:MAG: nucleoside monophosphate kinase [Syntrophaceae bacterium]